MSILTNDRAKEAPAEMALADERGQMSWAELDDTLNRAGNAVLAAVGTKRRAAVFAENAVETAIAHSACISVGLSSVPTSFHLTAGEVAYILEDSESAVLFVGPETAERGVEAAVKSGVDLVVGWRCPEIPGLVPWDRWLAEASPDAPPADMEPRPFLHYTSGTTGRPKGAETPPSMFPGGATMMEYVENLRTRNFVLGPALLVSPMYHTGPLSSVRALGAGVSLVVLGRFDPEQTLEMIERYGIKSTVMVPTHFVRLLALPDKVRGRFDTSSLQMVAHTGAACPVAVKRRMIEWWGPVFIEAYGATESGTTNMITSPEWLEHPGSVGRTLPPFELLVIGDDGSPVSQGEVGTLYFRDATGRGIVYHNDAEKTAAAHLEPGVFTLGEMGYADADGYVYITDRVSDMVVSGGVNIYPAEAELILMDHAAVDDVACIGVPNEEMGEELKALVVPANPADPPAPDALLAFCRERLAHYKCPRTVEFVADLGRNSMGKVNKRVLRAPYWPSERTIG